MATGFEKEQEAISPRDYSVLICDDDDSIRSLLNTAVKEWEFNVSVASSGEDALQQFEEVGGPDVLLTDINMGGMSGVELANQVKQRFRDTEVIIMTAQASFETAVQAMRIGVFDYLCKPFDDLDDIKSTLLHVCRRIYLRFRNEYLVNELARKHREIECLARMSKELAENLDLTQVIQIGCEGLSRAFGDCPVAFFQYLPAQGAIVGAVRHPGRLFSGGRPSRMLPEGAARDMDSLREYFNNIMQDSVFRAQIDRAQDDRGQLTPGACWKSIAFVTRDVPRGLFLLRVDCWSETEDELLLQRYTQTLSTAFENALMHAQLVDSSITDGLTGLCNVRHLKERLDGEIRRATRLKHPVSFLFVDVDHFKQYNDTHGHPAGDEVLRIISGAMLRSFRTTDLCARYGGEEFCVVMPDTAHVDAMQRAEKFRGEIEAIGFPNEATQPLGKVSISIGVAEFPTHGGNVDSLIEVADAALYGAKRTRNAVMGGSPPAGYEPLFPSRAIRSAFTKPERSAPAEGPVAAKRRAG